MRKHSQALFGGKNAKEPVYVGFRHKGDALDTNSLGDRIPVYEMVEYVKRNGEFVPVSQVRT